MNRKLWVFVVGGLLVTLGLALAIAPTVEAGGWATVTLDTVPMQTHAGEPLSLGFTVRQHGVSPLNTVKPYLSAENRDNGDTLRNDARQEGPVGHFVVEVIFPSAGTWDWKIVPDPFPAIPEGFEPLVVLPAAAPSGSAAPSPDSISPSLWRLAAVAGLAAVGLALALRGGVFRHRWGVVLGTLVLAAAALAMVFGPSAISGAADSAGMSAAADPIYGRAVFIGKGCAACHQHSRVSLSVPGPVIGPNLTLYQGEESFLRSWLQDPQAARPGTRMPDPNLKDAEVEALITFLRAGAEK
jgi:cytochrome c2